MKTVSFQVQAISPYKQSTADEIERRHQTERKKSLQDVARDSFTNHPILSGHCSVSIRYYRYQGKADGANIIGGVLDSLQGIIFENDRQVIEFSYTELKGNSDWYQVTATVVIE